MSPAGWEEVRLGDLGRCLRGVSYDPRNDLRASDSVATVRLLRSNNVQQSLLGFDEVQFVSEARVSDEQILRPGDIVVCMANGSKALVGKSGVFRRVETQRYTFGAFMGCFRTDRSKAAPLFVRYLFLTKAYQDYINNLLAGSAINNLAPSSIESLAFTVPPLKEQEAIAEALSDADAAIETLNALIAKKRDVKQAAMQQLLTGRTRLPGFEGHWRTLGFDQALRRTRGPGRALLAGEYTDAGSLPIIDQSQAPIAGWTDRTDLRVECPAGGVIVFGDHTRVVKFVGSDFVVGADGTQVLSPVGNSDARFLAYLLQRAEIPNTGYNRHFKFLKDLRLDCPGGTEQRAIAQVLSDLDAEVDAVVAQRDKLRLVKQGMMQELLSGRVRLV